MYLQLYADLGKQIVPTVLCFVTVLPVLDDTYIVYAFLLNCCSGLSRHLDMPHSRTAKLRYIIASCFFGWATMAVVLMQLHVNSHHGQHWSHSLPNPYSTSSLGMCHVPAVNEEVQGASQQQKQMQTLLQL